MSEGETLNMGDMDGAERTTTEEETEAGEAASKYSTSVKLKQQLCIVPGKLKECYLVYILTKMTGRTCMVFARTCDTTNLLARLLRNLGIRAIPINGQMTRTRRLRAVNQFKAGECKILICTDMASRGLHFDGDLVINYEVPPNSKDYIHRVGRTGRAERSAVAISLVNQFEVEWYLNIEALLGFKLTRVSC